VKVLGAEPLLLQLEGNLIAIEIEDFEQYVIGPNEPCQLGTYCMSLMYICERRT
jgi:hypothetical protein